MRIPNKKTMLKSLTLIVVTTAASCTKPETTELAPHIELGTTIGSLVEVFSYQTIPLEGYSLVGALDGTGSGQCPQPIKEYLEKYIHKQLPEQQTNIDKIIGSPNTAVVMVRALMLVNMEKDSHFDVKVEALTGTQTMSLEGGWLYKTELKPIGAFAVTLKVFATAAGPIFIDKIDPVEVDKRTGYVLGGGTVLEQNKIMLGLLRPDYKTANAIRNRVNSRFGFDTAKALTDSQIELSLPDDYSGRSARFIELVKSIYMQQSPALTNERILVSVKNLAVSSEKQQSEISLEAIGRQSIDKLSALLNHSDEEVRLRSARCLLNLGDDQGLERLRDISSDETSPCRLDAIEAIAHAANRNEAANIIRKLLKDDNFDIRLAAYENLRGLDDIFITQDLIAESFFLEQIIQTPYKSIYVTRSGPPRIVLFGSPIYCRPNSFIQSADGQITINAPAGQNYVSIIRKHPTRPEAIIKLQCSFELTDIIRTLAERPMKKTKTGRTGLGISYSELISILKQMSETGAIEADFKAGPTPKIELNIKK